jgi:hypothetical protein
MPHGKLAFQVKEVAGKSTGHNRLVPGLVWRRSTKITSINRAQPSTSKWKRPDGRPTHRATPKIEATVATTRPASSLKPRRASDKSTETRKRTRRDVISNHGPTLKWKDWDGRPWDLRSVHSRFDDIMSEVESQQKLAHLAQQSLVSSHDDRYRLSEFLKKYHQSKLDTVLSVLPFRRYLCETEVALSIAKRFTRLYQSHRKVRSMMIECDAFSLTNMAFTHFLQSLYDIRLSKVMRECTPLFAKHAFTKELILREEHQAQTRMDLNAKEIRTSIKQRGDTMPTSYNDDSEYKIYWDNKKRHLKKSSLWLTLARLNDMEPRVWPAEGLLTILHMIQKKIIILRNELNTELKELCYSHHFPSSSNKARDFRFSIWLQIKDPLKSLTESVDDIRTLSNDCYALRLFYAAILSPEKMERIINLTRTFYFTIAARVHADRGRKSALQILAGSQSWKRTLKGGSTTAGEEEHIEDLSASEYKPFQPIEAVWEVEYQPLQQSQPTKYFHTSKSQNTTPLRYDYLAFNWEDWDGQPWDIVKVSNSIRVRVLEVDTQKQEIRRLAQQGPIFKDDSRFRLHDFLTKYHQARLDVAEVILRFRLFCDEMRIISFALRSFAWNYNYHARLKSLLSVIGEHNLSNMAFDTDLKALEDFRLLAAVQIYDPSSIRSGVGKYKILQADHTVRNDLNLQGKTARWVKKTQTDVSLRHARMFSESDAYRKFKTATNGLYMKLSMVEKLSLLFDTEPHVWPAEGLNTNLRVVQRRIMVLVQELNIAILDIRHSTDFTQKQINARRTVWMSLITINNRIANTVWKIRESSHAMVALTNFRVSTLSLPEVEKYALRSRNLHFNMNKRVDIERGLERGFLSPSSLTMSRIASSKRWKRTLRERMSDPGQHVGRTQDARAISERVVEASRTPTHQKRKRTDSEKNRARPPKGNVEKERHTTGTRGSSAHVSEDILSVLTAAHTSMQTRKLL